jgi:predicted Zn-dependent peptidase
MRTGPISDRLKRRAPAAAALAAGLCLLAPSVPTLSGADGAERSFTLANGLRVFLYEKRDLPLVHVVTGFDVGSKNETEATSGLVHLLEHCLLFRGTAASGGASAPSEVRRRGAYVNAHTSQDLTVFEMSVPAAEAGFALRHQRDILFGLDLAQAELDAEKEVILEEFNQMEDDPRRRATDLVLQALFPGHPYGRSVYGRREVIREVTVEDVLAFHRRYFMPANAALAAVGDFDAAEMERDVRAVFGGLAKADPPAQDLPMAEALAKGVSRRLESDVEDGYLYLGFVGPDFNDPDQYAVHVLTEVLGRGVNPVLPALLRSERNIFLTVDMAYLANRYGGAVIVSIRADPKSLSTLERLAASTLRRAHTLSYARSDFPPEAEPFAFDYLESAKNQIRFASGRAEESGLQLAASLVRYILLNTREDAGRYLEGIDRVSSGDLRKAASRYLAKGESAAVTIVPGRAK